MFEILKKYETNGSFLFNREDRLNQKCNAPNNKSGVYLFYDNESNELIYIGRSGKLNNDGTMFVRQGGIKKRIVNGKQFGQPRRKSLPLKMEEEGIKTLKICWFITHSSNYTDCPSIIKCKLLNEYEAKTGNLPRWNNQGC